MKHPQRQQGLIQCSLDATAVAHPPYSHAHPQFILALDTEHMKTLVPMTIHLSSLTISPSPCYRISVQQGHRGWEKRGMMLHAVLDGVLFLSLIMQQKLL